MNLNWVQIILLTINVNFLVFAVFLIKNRNGTPFSNKILGISMCLLAYVNTHFVFLYDKKNYLFFPDLVGTHMPVLFLIPPFVYFFYKSVFDDTFRLRGNKNTFFHFIPAVIVLFLYLPLYFSSTEYKVNFIQTGNCYFPLHWISIAFFTFFVGYLVLIIVDLNRNIKNSRQRMSSYLSAYFNTARTIAFLLIITLIIAVALKLNIINIPIITSLVFYYIIYQVLVHPEIFFACKFATEELAIKKYQSNELTQEEIDRIFNHITDYIHQQEVFLDSGITLPRLSYQLSIQTHKVSQAINRKAGLNFNDYINQFRSEYCKEKLMDENYTHYTIEALGKLSGFRSRQTLIKSFKKFYNKTPSEFLKRDK